MKSLLFSLALLLVGLTSYSQNDDSDFESYFSIKAGLNQVDSSGDQSPFDSFSDSNEAAFTNPYALGVDYRFSRLFSVGLFGSINKWEAGKDIVDRIVVDEDLNYSAIDLNLKLYLDQILFGKKNYDKDDDGIIDAKHDKNGDGLIDKIKRRRFEIYISAGGGYFTERDSGISGNLGAGTNLWLTDNWGVNIEGMGKFSEEQFSTSNHFQYFAGVTYRFGSDKEPDTDKDGIIDINDKCPKVPGVASNDGCPEPKDTDGDGIIDDEDKCPNVPGVVLRDGCPEPKDTDGDGIIDDEDNCPNIVGTSANKGCPEVEEKEEEEEEAPKISQDDIRKNILLLSKEVLFDVDSYVIRPDAIVKLDQIIEYLRLVPNPDLFISGHTDSTGSTQYNSNLSVNRANVVKQYLLDSGLTINSIVTEGQNESDPIASNLTVEGRQRNRRIEIYLMNE